MKTVLSICDGVRALRKQRSAYEVRNEWVFLYQAGWHRRNLSPVPAKLFAETGVFYFMISLTKRWRREFFAL